MSDLKTIKAADEVPGLAYFAEESPKTAKTATVAKPDLPQPRVEIAVLEQMYGYFAA
ncbi:MAG: hypothetical protein ACOH2H_15635 [Cypionkella sp.]